MAKVTRKQWQDSVDMHIFLLLSSEEQGENARLNLRCGFCKSQGWFYHTFCFHDGKARVACEAFESCQTYAYTTWRSHEFALEWLHDFGKKKGWIKP